MTPEGILDVLELQAKRVRNRLPYVRSLAWRRRRLGRESRLPATRTARHNALYRADRARRYADPPTFPAKRLLSPGPTQCAKCGEDLVTYHGNTPRCCDRHRVKKGGGMRHTSAPHT